MDDLFIAGLILIMIGAAVFVMRSGFLDVFFEGFSLLKRAVLREPEALTKQNQLLSEDPDLIQWKTKLAQMVMFAGLAGGAVAVLISCINLV